MQPDILLQRLLADNRFKRVNVHRRAAMITTTPCALFSGRTHQLEGTRFRSNRDLAQKMSLFLVAQKRRGLAQLQKTGPEAGFSFFTWIPIPPSPDCP